MAIVPEMNLPPHKRRWAIPNMNYFQWNAELRKPEGSPDRRTGATDRGEVVTRGTTAVLEHRVDRVEDEDYWTTEYDAVVLLWDIAGFEDVREGWRVAVEEGSGKWVEWEIVGVRWYFGDRMFPLCGVKRWSDAPVGA